MPLRRLLLAAVFLSLGLQFAAAEGPPDAAPVTGAARPELKALDDLMTAFLRDQKAPGAAVAVAKDGRLVYARGFGYADVEGKQPVQPDSLFRIASVSKWLTLAAVCRLVEQGKLAFDDKVYDILQLQPPNGAKVDPRWKDVTVEHLCTHKGGWDRAASGDPMFKPVLIARAFDAPPPATAEQVVRYMLGQPLDFDPGSKQVYSNFGYCVLGRVIEKRSGKAYDRFVRDELLAPIGVTRTQLGRTLTTARGEVRYYDTSRPHGKGVFPENLDREVMAPYGAWHLEAMDAHGGWIASAPDLVRFGCAVGDPERFPAYRGDAFRGRFGPNAGHAGALDGTSTLLRREVGGVTWCLLFNARMTADGKSSLVDAVGPRVQEVLRGVKQWPDGDLLSDLKYDERTGKGR